MLHVKQILKRARALPCALDGDGDDDVDEKNNDQYDDDRPTDRLTDGDDERRRY